MIPHSFSNGEDRWESKDWRQRPVRRLIIMATVDEALTDGIASEMQ